MTEGIISKSLKLNIVKYLAQSKIVLLFCFRNLRKNHFISRENVTRNCVIIPMKYHFKHCNIPIKENLVNPNNVFFAVPKLTTLPHWWYHNTRFCPIEAKWKHRLILNVGRTRRSKQNKVKIQTNLTLRGKLM